jgi:recombination protein RecT
VSSTAIQPAGQKTTATSLAVLKDSKADAGSRCQALTHLLKTKAGDIQALLPKNVDAERFIQSILLAARHNADILECDIASIFKAAYTIASTGLMLDPHFGQAYFVPFYNNKAGKKEAQAIIGYKGLMSLVRNSEEIAKWEVMEVYEKDQFDYQIGTNSVFFHRPDIFGERGEIRGFYSLVTYNSGLTDLEVMSKADIEKIRLSSKGKDLAPWREHYNEMAKKTVVRRHSKRLPMALTKQLANAMVIDNAAHNGTQAVIDVESGYIAEVEPEPEVKQIAAKSTPASQLDNFAEPQPAPEPPPEPQAPTPDRTALINKYMTLIGKDGSIAKSVAKLTDADLMGEIHQLEAKQQAKGLTND